MNTSNRTKINQLNQKWIRGTIYITPVLNSMGYSNGLLSQYKRSNWIEFIGPRAYKLSGDTIDWTGALYTLQTQHNLLFHPGGKSALVIQGYAHYLAPKLTTLYLYGLPKEKLPYWFTKYNWDVNIVTTSTNLFSCSDGLIDYTYKEYSIKISSPERAILELLFYIPYKQGFDESMKIFENLTTLRPGLLQVLLESCNSIKVKRLFLYMAGYNKYKWFKKLKLEKINIGFGKREIVKNGVLNKKYLITVPKIIEEEIP